MTPSFFTSAAAKLDVVLNAREAIVDVWRKAPLRRRENIFALCLGISRPVR
jgi:hypothetical protein